LADSVSYERTDWKLVDNHIFRERDLAINHARNLAAAHGLHYQLFESRYDEELNEYLGEFGVTKSRVHPLMMMLGSVPEWEPVAFVLNGDKLEETQWKATEIDRYLRIECWVETANQYVYVQRRTVDDPWSIPIMGEHPADGKPVHSMEDLAFAMVDDLDRASVHPLLWPWYRWAKRGF
jgi:hypothetical protein